MPVCSYIMPPTVLILKEYFEKRLNHKPPTDGQHLVRSGHPHPPQTEASKGGPDDHKHQEA